MTITCRDTEEINILSASYGRTKQDMCSHILNKDTNCHAGTSMRVARFECQGQPRCTLHAKNSAFGDPCVGTFKYLEVKYECVHKTELFDDGWLVRVCEGAKQTIHCKAPQKLHIVSANYGRLTGGHICPGPVKTTNCGAAVSQAKVTHNCDGKQECVLEATNGQFGDPCVGTRKYLEVRYRCVHEWSR